MGMTNQGLNHALDVILHAASQITTWYLGLIRDDNYTALAVGDTLASHAGWEAATEYTGDRKEFVEAAASGQSITNSANKADFVITSAQTMKGLFLCSAASGTVGTLFCTALFTGGDQAVETGDTLRVTLTTSGA